jgi:hypothetical protein
MTQRIIGRGALLWLGLAMAVLILAGCERARASAEEMRIGARLDMTPLVQAAQPVFEAKGVPFTLAASESLIEDLKAGKLDVVVLGREPTPEEKAGLVDRVIALDAVCLVVDTRSYLGGMQVDLAFHPKLRKVKTYGLQGLTLEEVRKLYGNRVRADGPVWQWEGSYYVFENTGKGVDKISEDPKKPGYAVGEWVQKPVYLIPDVWRPSKVDTQSALFSALGLPEGAIVSAGHNLFLPKFLESEEELVSFRYSRGAPPAWSSNEQIPFQMAVLSRRVTRKAIDHGFRLRVVAIGGLDPVQDPATVYDGTYPLSRKIHVLLRSDAPPAAVTFADFFSSAEGQQAVADSGFLPLPTIGITE